ADAEKPGAVLTVGTAEVPVGAYTETVLERLPAAQRATLRANIRDREPDVTGIVGKLTEGAADAGFLYITDVAATHGQLEAVALPASLQPRVAYGAAVVSGSGHEAQARAFVDGLLRGPGRAAPRAPGFRTAPPPQLSCRPAAGFPSCSSSRRRLSWRSWRCRCWRSSSTRARRACWTASAKPARSMP